MNANCQILLPLLLAGCGGSADSSISTSETSETSQTSQTSQTSDLLLPPEALVVTADSLLLVPSFGFLGAYDNNGKEVYEWDFADIVDSYICDGACKGQGLTPDGDGFYVSYVKGDTRSKSGIMRFSFSDGELAPQWQRNNFETYVHDATPMPKTEAGMIVLETSANKVSWFAEKSDLKPLFSVNNESPLWESSLDSPNGLQQFSSQGRDFLLINWRQDSSTPIVAGGLISLWEITDPLEPVTVWNYPQVGRLSEPHGAALRYYDGEIYLLYGHSKSLTVPDELLTGTIGIAKSSNLFTAPTYFADISTGKDYLPMEYPRSADLTSDGNLIICATGEQGWVWEVPLPNLFPTDKSGQHTESKSEMNIIELNGGRVLVEDLLHPFEATFWTPQQ
jgi:hypothetical protein